MARGQLWGFYGRSSEQAEIERILDSGRWFFCSISGRRRIGKTTLIQRALQKRPSTNAVYVQVPDSDERGVVEAFRDAMEDAGGLPRDLINPVAISFRDLATLIGAMCHMGWIVIIDEFQYFHRKALSPFASYLQAEVDKLRDNDRGGLFVLGSIHTEMTAILEDRDSPLFNRVTHRIKIGHWDFETLFEMFDAHEVIDVRQRLFLWGLFEGVPKFYRDCFEAGVLERSAHYRENTLRRLFFEGTSPLRDEATNWFLRELRGRYDSVLKLLAKRGPCAYGTLVADYAEAGSAGEKQLSQYLQTLIERYGMVERRLPVFAADKTRKARYYITDNFLAAWLHALARNAQMARVRPVAEAVGRADRALEVHEGFSWEKMTRLLLEECSRKAVGDFALTDVIKGYWNKSDGSDIEIDIVAINSDSKTVRFGSCKRTSGAHDEVALNLFSANISRFLSTGEGRRFTDWKVERAVYSPSISRERRKYIASQGYICRDLFDFSGYLGRPVPALFGEVGG